MQVASTGVLDTRSGCQSVRVGSRAEAVYVDPPRRTSDGSTHLPPRSSPGVGGVAGRGCHYAASGRTSPFGESGERPEVESGELLRLLGAPSWSPRHAHPAVT